MSALLVAVLAAAISLWSAPAAAQDGRVTVVARAPFKQVAEALVKSIAAQGMAVVCHADAQRGAAARGVTINGTHVMACSRTTSPSAS